MKKFIIALIATLFSMSAVFAGEDDRSVHWLGLSLPVQDKKVTDDFLDDEDEADDLISFGINVFYNHMTVSESGFSKFIDCEMGYSRSYIESDDADWMPANWFTERFAFGLGVAFVNVDNIIIALHGTLGIEGKTGSVSYEGDGNETHLMLNSFVGANMTCAVKFNESLGFSMGTMMYTNLIGIDAVMEIDEDADFDLYAYAIRQGRFNIDFKLGFCYMY